MHVLPSVTTEIKPDAADHALFPTALAVLKHICGQTTEFARSIVFHVRLECAFHVVYAVLESALVRVRARARARVSDASSTTLLR